MYLVVTEVDVEVAALGFLGYRLIGKVLRSGVTISFSLCVTTLVCFVLFVSASGEIKGWLTYPSSYLNLIELVSQFGTSLYFLCHGVSSIIESIIP